MGRRRCNNGGHSEVKSKDDLWKGALEKDIGDGNRVQMIGMDSPTHTVFARVVPPPTPSSSSASAPAAEAPAGAEEPSGEEEEATASAAATAKVTVGKVVEVMVDEEWRHVVRDILEKGEHVDKDSHPGAKQLLELGAVWLVNETLYAKGEDAHAHRLSTKDASTAPNWEDMTLRVHYVPDRFHVAHEVDWSKYCRGLLIGESVEVRIGEEKPHVPMAGLPDSKDGAIVYDNADLGFAVLNKPGGMPGHGTKSNHAENIVTMFSEALKGLRSEQHNRKVHVTLPQRVDTEAHGLILASTKKEFGTYFADHLACTDNDDQPASDDDAGTKGVKKRYRCLVCVKDLDGMDRIQKFQESATVVTHYLDPKSPSARKRFVRNKPKSGGGGWVPCRLRVVRVGGSGDRLRAACVLSESGDSVHPDSTLARRLWGAESATPAEDLGASYVMQLEIEPLGPERGPHHVRGQLAALGCPIVGDVAYGGGTSVTGAHRHVWKRMALQCCEMSFAEPRWEERQAEGEKGGGKELVPSDCMCSFRLSDAWWTPYLEQYDQSV